MSEKSFEALVVLALVTLVAFGAYHTMNILNLTWQWGLVPIAFAMIGIGIELKIFRYRETLSKMALYGVTWGILLGAGSYLFWQGLLESFGPGCC